MSELKVFCEQSSKFKAKEILRVGRGLVAILGSNFKSASLCNNLSSWHFCNADNFISGNLPKRKHRDVTGAVSLLSTVSLNVWQLWVATSFLFRIALWDNSIDQLQWDNKLSQCDIFQGTGPVCVVFIAFYLFLLYFTARYCFTLTLHFCFLTVCGPLDTALWIPRTENPDGIV